MDKQKIKIALGIDPSLRNTGWAVVLRPQKRREKWRVIRAGTIVSRRAPVNDPAEALMKMASVIHAQMQMLQSQCLPAGAGLEWPEFRSGSVIGHSAAARGDLVWLAVFSGVVLQQALCNGFRPGSRKHAYKNEVIRITPTQWKGQVTKEITRARLARLFDVRQIAKYNEHECDAIGIAMYTFGHAIDSDIYKCRKEKDYAQ